jgi:hypothetical protein
MKTKRYIGLLLALTLCLGLIAYAPGAGAADRLDYTLNKGAEQKSGDLQVKVQHSRPSRMPVNVVVYDQDGKVVAGADLPARAYTFKELKVGDYQVIAEADDIEFSLAQDVPVFADQTTQVEMQLERPAVRSAAENAAGGSVKGKCSVGSGGDGSLIKVYPSFGTTIIYMQCGRVVGKVLPTGCGCSAGNWRYTTDCQKSAPIYVNLPCPGR